MSAAHPPAARDAWEWTGVLAWLTAALLVVHSLATGATRDYPGTLILLGLGGLLLLTYRRPGGLFASRPPAFRRMLGLGIAAPGFLLAALELVR